MKSTVFANALAFVNGKFKKSQILVTDGIIEAVGNTIPIPEGAEILDCSKKRILPGLIDIHTHGCNGFDFSTASPEDMHRMLQWYAKKGVVAILPTTMTDSAENMNAAMLRLQNIHRDQRAGNISESRVVGIHAEGPFFDKGKKGAHCEKYLRPVDEGFFHQLFLSSGGLIRMVDIDPTLPDAFDFIDRHRKDFIVSLAHTACSYETARQASLAGVTHITHLFNAMNGMHHREPGLIGALYDFGFYADIICDGLHVHPAVLRLMFASVPEKLVIISDSMSAAGLQDGNYKLGGQEVTVKNGCATLKDGTLAGSTTNVFDSMVRLIQYGIPATDAISAATESAALSAGIGRHHGFIKKGRAADLLVLDMDYHLENVWLSGKLFHNAAE